MSFYSIPLLLPAIHMWITVLEYKNQQVFQHWYCVDALYQSKINTIYLCTNDKNNHSMKEPSLKLCPCALLIANIACRTVLSSLHNSKKHHHLHYTQALFIWAGHVRYEPHTPDRGGIGTESQQVLIKKEKSQLHILSVIILSAGFDWIWENALVFQARFSNFFSSQI